jgi:SAM-dependent methyltransferase
MYSRPTQLIPALDDAADYSDVDRGSLFLGALEQVGVSVVGATVADLGTGFGSIAIAAAKRGARGVLAVDVDPDRLSVVRGRARAAEVELETVEGNLLDLPASLGHIDIAFLIGVVEYAGLWDPESSVDDLQQRVLKTGFDALKPGGVLIVGSKNRLWPWFFLKDAHTGRPLVNFLPRQWADSVSRTIGGRPYRHHIHSPQRWARMLQSVGFSSVTCFFPYFSYQFPLFLVARPSFGAIREVRVRLRSMGDTNAAIGRLWRLKAAVMAFGGAAHVPLSHGVILVARK